MSTRSLDALEKFIIDLLATPGGKLYLSTVLGQSKDPSLEPYQASDVYATTLDLGAFGEVKITLDTLTINGVTNVQLARKADGTPDVSAEGSVVTFHAIRPNTEAPPHGVPTMLTVSATWHATINNSNTPTAPVRVTIATASLTGRIQAAGDIETPSAITVTFKSFQANINPDPQNIHIDLSGWDSVFRAQVEKFVNQPATLTTLVGMLNGQIGSAQVLSALSQAATATVQGVVAGQA